MMSIIALAMIGKHLGMGTEYFVLMGVWFVVSAIYTGFKIAKIALERKND